MNITQMYKYNVCSHVRKFLTKDIHTEIILTKKSQVQKRLTRQANNICLPLFRSTHLGAQLYNKLPNDIKAI